MNDPMRLAAAAVAALAIALGAADALAVAVAGRVVDRAGRPIEVAPVSAPALKLGASTDADGRFTLTLPAGPVTLEVQQLGYERRRLQVTAQDGAPALVVTLADEPVALAEVSVTASSFGKVGKGEGATLRRMQVLTTPGGAADVFQSLRALPGINAPSEGAAVYVRGGPPDETLLRLDGGEMGHPYHYEGASGGLFSALDSYMLKSAFFSSGAFSAKYGGVLSGVLDVETQDPMNLRTVSLGANFAGGGGSTSWALVPDKLSLVTSVRASNPRLLYDLYGSARSYEVTPRSHDAATRLLWRHSPAGRLALFHLDSGDRSTFEYEALGYRNRLAQRGATQLGALQFQEAVGRTLAIRGQLGGQFWHRAYAYGPFHANEAERNLQGNVDAVWDASPRHQVAFGANLRRRDAERTGALAADSTDLSSGAPTRDYATRALVGYPGVYVEDKLRVAGPVYATLGARFDRASVPGVWTADPRASLAWRVDERQTLRLATGRYHQLALPRYLDPVYGNPQLGPLEADHVVAGYEWKSEHTNVRVEAFRKDYRDLVTNDAATFYANGGRGFARGVDLFVQGERKWLSGWLSYGYLDTKRREFSNPRELPASYGVRHTLSLVATYQLTPSLHLGGRLGASSGRPYTPVASAAYDSAAGLWRPSLAEDNSGRLPDYERLDLRVMQLFSLPKALGLPESSICVAYAEALNVLDRRNVLDYTYSPDYSRRFAQESYFGRRMVVCGFALTW